MVLLNPYRYMFLPLISLTCPPLSPSVGLVVLSASIFLVLVAATNVKSLAIVKTPVELCPNCGENSHTLPCRNPPKCCNCEEAHPASSQKCFYFTLEQEILSTQVHDRSSYRDARRRVTSRFHRPNQNYASVLSHPPPPSPDTKAISRGPPSSGGTTRAPRQPTAGRVETSVRTGTPSASVPSSSTPRPAATTKPSITTVPTPKTSQSRKSSSNSSRSSCIVVSSTTTRCTPSSSGPSSQPPRQSALPVTASSLDRDRKRERSYSSSRRSPSVERPGKCHASSSSSREHRRSLLDDYPMPPSFPLLPPTPVLAQAISANQHPSHPGDPTPPDDLDLPSPSPVFHSKIYTSAAQAAKSGSSSKISTVISSRPPL